MIGFVFLSYYYTYLRLFKTPVHIYINLPKKTVLVCDDAEVNMSCQGVEAKKIVHR